MLCQGSRRDAWLRLTPEPERVLPTVVAALRTHASPPSTDAVAEERRHLVHLVLHGDADGWLGYLAEVTRLAVAAGDDPARRPDALVATEVVRDHHRLLIGLSRTLAAQVSTDRSTLEALAARLRAGEALVSDRLASDR